jgi:hypothetical protein
LAVALARVRVVRFHVGRPRIPFARVGVRRIDGGVRSIPVEALIPLRVADAGVAGIWRRRVERRIPRLTSAVEADGALSTIAADVARRARSSAVVSTTERGDDESKRP